MPPLSLDLGRINGLGSKNVKVVLGSSFLTLREGLLLSAIRV